MVMFKVRLAVKSRHSSEVAMPGKSWAMPRLCKLYPGICFTSEKKGTEKTSFSVVEKSQLFTIQYVDLATF